MIVSSPIPRGLQPGYHEGSYMRSIRDSDSTSRQWQRARKNATNSVGTDLGLRFMSQQLNRSRRRILGGGAADASGGVDFKGEWDSSTSYKAKVIVFYTPNGGSAGAYISLQSVTAGTPPDAGAPNWVAFPAPAPGMFGA